MSIWLGSYRQKHAFAKRANSAERSPSLRETGRPAYVSRGDMPRGYGKCQHCGEYGWLPEGPVDIPCERCSALLADEAEAGHRAVASPDALADPAELVLNGELE